MKKGTLYLNHPIAPCNQDWLHVYEIGNHDVKGISVKDGSNVWHWFPTHEIQRLTRD